MKSPYEKILNLRDRYVSLIFEYVNAYDIMIDKCEKYLKNNVKEPKIEYAINVYIDIKNKYLNIIESLKNIE